MRFAAIGLALAAAATAAPAQMAEPPHIILVTGDGRALTPPDQADLAFEIRGEGASADEASTMVAARMKDIRGGLAAVLGPSMHFDTGDYQITQVKSRSCDEQPYGARRLSTGDCAVVGYVAILPVTVRTDAVREAGTAAGLAGRLGAVNTRMMGYMLKDVRAAQARATAVAITNAREKAQAIADASGLKLGPVVRVQDANIVQITANDLGRMPQISVAAPAPPPPPPPVKIDLSPRPIETEVRINVAFAIEP